MKKKILLQFDHDQHASSFDSIVAIDSGVNQLLRYSNVTPIQIESLVHGCIFTRGAKDLHQTAIYFGGSDVYKTTELYSQAKKCFFGPMRVSLMSDPNGSNTTAAAAVLCAQNHFDLAGKNVTVLAATGPVGQRICRLVANAGGKVTVCSRSMSRAEKICQQIAADTGKDLIPMEASVPNFAAQACDSADIVFAAGAAGVELLDENWIESNSRTQLAIDINAVPPVGIAGVEVFDNAKTRKDVICYGAIGVGELKMKIHKRCIEKLFESNDQELDIDEIYQIGRELSKSYENP